MQHNDHSDQDRFSRDEERGEDYDYDIDDDEDVDDDDDAIDDNDDGDKNVCRFSSIFSVTRSQTWCIWLGVR